MFDKRKKQLEAELAEAKKKATEVMQLAEKDNRELTADERKSVEDHLKAAKDLKAKIDQITGDEEMLRQIDALQTPAAAQVDPSPDGTGTGGNGTGGGNVRQCQSLGAQFVSSAEYKKRIQPLAARGARKWQSEAIDLAESGIRAATLTTDTASGGKLIQPDVRPGILELLFRRLTVADLIAPGTTDSNLIKYLVELAYTNAAAAVAAGATKPESAITFDDASDEVKKIAHWMPVQDEMLEDVSQIRSFIDARLILGLDLVEEDQLLNGSGAGANIRGIRNRVGLQTAVARGADSNPDAIFKQMMAIMTNAFVFPDGVVMNPINWQTIVLSKNAAGDYYAGGPFNTPPTPVLWGIPGVITPAIVANTATVGAFRTAAQIFRKGGVQIEASNSHSDFFIKNLTAIRAERRLALAVYRPAGFGDVTGLA